MKKGLLFLLTTALISCQSASTNNTQRTDTAGVVTLPADSIDNNMPVRPMDTATSYMPVIDTDTGNVEPK